jgi:hypothetical protein
MFILITTLVIDNFNNCVLDFNKFCFIISVKQNIQKFSQILFGFFFVDYVLFLFMQQFFLLIFK